MVHGVGLRAESFAPQIAIFKNSHSVHALDLPGHGHSVALGNIDPVLGDYTAMIEGFVDEVIGKPVIFVGHSMGAMLALDFARRNPDKCLGVACLNAVHRRSHKAALSVKQRAVDLRQNASAGVAAAPIARWFGGNPRGLDLEIAMVCSGWLEQADRQAYATAYGVFANDERLSEATLPQIERPHLFLTGAEDVNSTPEMSRVMADLVPQAEVRIISGARHLALLTHADQVNSALEAFLARCERQLLHRSQASPGVR
jgi:(E)-2-((N-methylformamido)methylene)succinate hydrolase